MGIWGIVVLAAAILAWGWLLRERRRAADLEEKVRERTEALALRNKALERLHHQLQKNLEGRIQLMNTVVHDLRSPLTSILVSVDRLRGMHSHPEGILDLLERESLRLEQILGRLLDQSRCEGLYDTLNLRLCRPTEIHHGLADTIRFRAEAKELTAHLDLATEAQQVWILADTTALQQVLFNLLENALKFTPPPGTVGIRTRVEPEAFHMEVWDTGRGIEPARQERLFQPFHQDREEDSASGWGLGLSICHTLVQAHQGRLELESEPGKGATFRVIIPLVLPRRS